jgi:hypothetical protein
MVHMGVAIGGSCIWLVDLDRYEVVKPQRWKTI